MDTPRRETVLARFSADELGAPDRGYLEVDVEALMPGPREGGLLLAFRPSVYFRWYGPLFFYSTVDRVLVPVGMAHDDAAAGFGGFSTATARQ